MTEESQNGCKEGQRTMTGCLTGTGEIPFITPPPLSLSNGLSARYLLVSYQLCLVLGYSCPLELDPGPQVSPRRSEPRYHQATVSV